MSFNLTRIMGAAALATTMIAGSAQANEASGADGARRMPQLPTETDADLCVKEYFDAAMLDLSLGGGGHATYDAEEVQDVLDACEAQTGTDVTLEVPENGLHFFVRPRPPRPFS